MNVIVQSIHFDADSKLVNFITEKVNKLTVFHDRIISSEVTLRVGSDSERPDNKHVEIRLAVPGPDLFAKRKGKTFEEAVISTVEALRTQVVRSKPDLRKAG